mgnify:CR=1 FL=1
MTFMWWIIGIVIVIAIIGALAESNDLSSKIMLFSGFLLILGLITSSFFEFMGFVAELSGFVLIASLVFKVFRKIFLT